MVKASKVAIHLLCLISVFFIGIATGIVVMQEDPKNPDFTNIKKNLTRQIQ